MSTSIWGRQLHLTTPNSFGESVDTPSSSYGLQKWRRCVDHAIQFPSQLLAIMHYAGLAIKPDKNFIYGRNASEYLSHRVDHVALCIVNPRGGNLPQQLLGQIAEISESRSNVVRFLIDHGNVDSAATSIVNTLGVFGCGLAAACP